ncbi:hypothetical protein EV127DRAFT_355719 [Xylaria flabelliformis]|nr:hypothetical protein EV127DRAFT_355719 [Xylaria flabelliformis]
MAVSNRPPRNAFVAGARKVYNPIGFSKGYNFILWFIFIGALFGFVLARFEYLNFWGIFCNPNSPGGNGAIPGECFYYTQPGRYQIGIILHLAAILPAGLLACFQFVPVIRHKALIFHRINGWFITLLCVLGTAGALMIARRAAGGGVDVQTLIGLLAIAFLGSLAIAIYNVKRLQIDQHRAWMIRAWAYGGSIITLRIGLIVGAIVISQIGGFYAAEPCDKVSYTVGGQANTMALYPECAAFFSGQNLNQQAIVVANFYGFNGMEVGAALNIAFGPAAWLALALHVFGSELYLRLTPAEHERLKNFSYQRQLEAGMKHPGRAGLTADRLGDANEWHPINNSDSDEPFKDTPAIQQQYGYTS